MEMEKRYIFVSFSIFLFGFQKRDIKIYDTIKHMKKTEVIELNNLLIAQSGGPTAAINATLAGALTSAVASGKIDHIFGAKHGIEGVLEDDLIDLDEVAVDPGKMELLMQTPSSVLGSCRYRLVGYEENKAEYEKIIATLQKYNIKYMIYIGGNDSMDTVEKLSNYCKKMNLDIYIVGAPKTIDNDLEGIDHTPGFGSAAKYIATTVSELERDAKVYNQRSVTVVEVMGRNAGWLTASSALSSLSGGEGPDLIYFSEHPFRFHEFSDQLERLFKEKDSLLIVVSEGLKDKYGEYISEWASEYKMDDFGHKQIAGVAHTLSEYIRRVFNCKIRTIELSTMQRSSSHIMSLTDVEEARKLGYYAVEYALKKETGKMSSLVRKDGEEYKVEYLSIPVEIAANKEKMIPKDWIDEENHKIREPLWNYLLPLIQGDYFGTTNNGIRKHLILF